MLVDKCVNPHTGRPYTSGVLDRALRATHFAVDPTRSAKQQALDALPRLQKEFAISRARMRFRLCVRPEHAAALRQLLRAQAHTLEAEDTLPGGQLAVTCTVEPGCYRVFDAFIRDECSGTGRLEVLALTVTEGSAQPDVEEHEHAQPAQQQPQQPAADALAARMQRTTVMDAGCVC